MSKGRATSVPTLDADGRSADDLTRDDLIGMYRLMLLSRRIDDKEIQLKNQSLIFFQISGAGHEAILVAAGLALQPGYDWFYPYYRDRALCLTLGMTPLRDVPRGRRLDGRPDERRPADAVALGRPGAPHRLAVERDGHAVPARRRVRRGRRLYERRDRHSRIASRGSSDDEVVYVSIGDGATSEGEFWESLSTACVRALPVVFLVEDNGYAISVPVEAQTPGGSISEARRGDSPISRSSRATARTSSRATGRCARPTAWCRDPQGPALVHASVVRPYSHSHSDDERPTRRRRSGREEARRDPIAKFAALLVEQGIATTDELAAIGQGRRSRGERGGRRGRRRRRSRRRTRPALYVYLPTSIPRRPAFDTAAAARGQAGHDGRRRSTAR